MKEIFDFKRFWTYFKYDLKQMWRNNSKGAILIGGASALLYVVWVLISLVFTQPWSSPIIEVRAVVLMLAFGILEMYQVRTYGYLTEKKAGSAWLMVPASRAEKYVSMLLMTLIVIPLLFFVVYLLIDGFLSLVDPTYGKALITGFMGAYGDVLSVFQEIGNESPITFTPSSLVFPTIVGFFCNFLYFLLCGICFKKNKLVCAIAITFGISMVVSLLMGLLFPLFVHNFDFEVDETQIATWMTWIMNASIVFTCLLTIGLGWGVWRRVKTLQH